MKHTKVTLGRNVFVDIVGHATNVPAKVDTGADSSSVWASGIKVLEDGTLQFKLFDSISPFYTGNVITTKKYSVATVRSTTGHEEIRYRPILLVKINNRRIKATFNLSNRSRNHFPILIGRRTLKNKFIVDVSLSDVEVKKPYKKIGTLNKELKKDPYQFYKKYHSNDDEQ